MRQARWWGCDGFCCRLTSYSRYLKINDKTHVKTSANAESFTKYWQPLPLDQIQKLGWTKHKSWGSCWHVVTVIVLHYTHHQQCRFMSLRAWLQGSSAIFRNGIISSWQCSNHFPDHLLNLMYVTFPYISMQPNEKLQSAATDSKGPEAVSRILCPEHPAARNFCPNKRS